VCFLSFFQGEAVSPTSRTTRCFPLLAFAAICLAVCSSRRADAAAYTYTTLDYPGASSSYLHGISNGVLVGGYQDGTGYHGYSYNMASQQFTSYTFPGTNGAQQYAYGISGNLVVGNYHDGFGVHGFTVTLNGSTYTSFDDPSGVGGTIPVGISSTAFVGYYGAGQGFIKTGNTYADVNVPGWAGSTYAYGVDDSGFITGTVGPFAHGFYGTQGNFTLFDVPGATSGTFGESVTNGMITGGYHNGTGDHGFLLSNGLYTTFDDPVANIGGTNRGTAASGTDGFYVVGYYNFNGVQHGFIATPVPEAGTMVGLVLGAGMLLRRRMRN
jgi:hypothetical protein